MTFGAMTVEPTHPPTHPLIPWILAGHLHSMTFKPKCIEPTHPPSKKPKKIENRKLGKIDILSFLIGQKKSIGFCDLKMCKRGGVLEKSGYLTSCTPRKFSFFISAIYIFFSLSLSRSLKKMATPEKQNILQSKN